ncbi:MAG TPA: gamma-glutamyl-gamma-aminobutyrate hydrolase family protein, partial [Candidatus Manganitrophaceae bacterium]
MKPVIGVTSDYNGGDRPEFGGSEETCYIRSRYLHAVEETGGAPVVLSPVDDPSQTAPSILDRI